MRRGLYILFFQLPESERITVGALGRVDLRPGHYAYVGSAMNGLDGRIARHMRNKKTKRWHIDYVLERAVGRRVMEFEVSQGVECELNRKLHLATRSAQPVRGFGSSDCRCHSHLHYLGEAAPQLTPAALL